MRLFPQELDISLSEGFSRELDIFGRKPFADRLTNIVKAVDSPIVILLDAPWGSGKTTFVKMWIGELHKIRFPVVYFDAFANDYQEDAFIGISSQIISELDRLRSKPSVVENFKRKAIGVAKIIGGSALRIGLKAATAGTIEYEDIGKAAAEAVATLSDEAGKGLEDILSKRLESHEKDRLAFLSFREALSGLASELSSELSSTDKSDQSDAVQPPLVFVIDELDRCRPSFALKVLENIKHFFSVPGISFVIVCSLEHLASSVRYAYGNIDATMYLEKFYHLRLLFPVGNHLQTEMATATYLRHLGCDGNTSELVDQFSRYRSVSLRSLERIVLYLKLARASAEPRALFPDMIVSVLCILKVLYPSEYDLARTQSLTYERLQDKVRFDLWRSKYNITEATPLAESTQMLWQHLLYASEDDGRGGQLASQLFMYGLTRDNIVPHFCGLIDGFSFPNP